jgi:hypothetical protein
VAIKDGAEQYEWYGKEHNVQLDELVRKRERRMKQDPSGHSGAASEVIGLLSLWG